MKDPLNKKITLADNCISLVMFIGFSILGMFLPVIALMSLIVYPSITLIIYGILKIHFDFHRKDIKTYRKILNISIGIIGLILSILMINYIITWDSEGASSYIIRLLAFPMTIIGIAGILKGIIVKQYSWKYRSLNVLIGILTFVFAYFSLVYAEIYFIFHITSTFILLLLNVFCRSAMYLSEFGISINKIRNFRIVLYIINNYTLENEKLARAVLREIQRD